MNFKKSIFFAFVSLPALLARKENERVNFGHLVLWVFSRNTFFVENLAEFGNIFDLASTPKLKHF